MLSNTLKCIGFKAAGYPNAGFMDAGNFSTWASGAINTVYSCGIMTGTSSFPKIFSSKADYTHEQSILTFNNLYDCLEKNSMIN